MQKGDKRVSQSSEKLSMQLPKLRKKLIELEKKK